MFLNSIKKDPQPIARLPPTPVSVAIAEPRPDPTLKTLAEIKATNPYDFSPEGFRCIVTLMRYNDTQSWWFPSCNRCSKSSTREGGGYKCQRDQCTGYKYKYKPDGLQLIRACHGSTATPSDIAAQVGQKNQLTLNVTSKAFLSSRYSYEVKRIDTAYGRQPALPAIESTPPANLSSQTKSDIEKDAASAVRDAEDQQIGDVVLDETHSPLNSQLQDVVTPPSDSSPSQTPVVVADQTSTVTKKVPKEMSARKRLQFKDDVLEKNKEHNPALEDNDADDVNRSTYISDSDSAPPKGSKKAPPAKKTKKS